MRNRTTRDRGGDAIAEGQCTLRALVALLVAGAAVTLAAQESSRSDVPATPVAPALEKYVTPVYPPIAIAAIVQGIVIVEATVVSCRRFWNDADDHL